MPLPPLPTLSGSAEGPSFPNLTVAAAMLAVSAALRVIVVAVSSLIYVPVAMPVPYTPMPVRSPAVLVTVRVLAPLLPVALMLTSSLLCEAPAASAPTNARPRMSGRLNVVLPSPAP